MSILKKNTAVAAAPAPYHLDARREWNERYGDYLKQAKAWRAFGLLSLGVTAIMGGSLGYIATQTRTVPYVVQVDKLGTVLPVARADQAARADAAVIRASLARWITDIRTVSLDASAQRNNVFSAYAMIEQGDGGWTVVSEFMRDHNPFKRAQNETVEVAIQSVLPTGAETWRVEWVETVRGRNGQQISQEQWSAVMTVRLAPPTSEEKILKNPLGIYISSVSWSPRI